MHIGASHYSRARGFGMYCIVFYHRGYQGINLSVIQASTVQAYTVCPCCEAFGHPSLCVDETGGPQEGSGSGI